MPANELCRDCGFTLLCCGDREVTGGVYCCDLLSIVMGRAPTDGVWFTVMANQNTIVAALMADVACVVLTEGIRPDEAMLARAAAENIAVATADCPSYAAARRAPDAFPAGTQLYRGLEGLVELAQLPGADTVLVEPFHLEKTWTFRLKRRVESVVFHRDYSKLEEK